MRKQTNFKRTALVIAVTAAFPLPSAYADEVADLINPNKAEVTFRLQNLDKVNPLYREYTGVDRTGINGSVDINYVNRSDGGAWTRLSARNLGLSTQELNAGYEKQGDWAIGFGYNQIPRYAPYDVSTRVSGIGTTTITTPNFSATPTLSPVTLKTERDITNLTGSKYLAEGLKLAFSFKNEDKTGTRMDGVRGGSGAVPPGNQYGNFMFAPEPINQTHQQFEGTLEYVTPKYQVTAGYYGSFLRTKNDSLNVIGGTNTAVYSSGGILLAPIALPPDNQSQQLYLNGGYNFSQDTRGTLKVAWSEGKQNDNFITRPQGDVLAGIGSNLAAVVRTTSVFGSLASRVTKDLNLTGTWRYENKKDETPVRLFYALFPNNPESHKTNRGKLDANYRLGAGYSLNAGIEYDKTENRSWARENMTEKTYRLAVRKAMSDTVNGTLAVVRSDRTGSDFTIPATIYATFLADRNRDKIRGTIDWTPAEKLNLQFVLEGFKDDFSKSTYGMDDGDGSIFSFDGSYLLNDNWKMHGWYSVQDGSARQYGQGAVCGVAGTCSGAANVTLRTATLIQYDATLKSNSDQLGFGVTGKVKTVDVGADFLYSTDKNSQKYSSSVNTGVTCTNATCTTTTPISAVMGLLPDTKYTQNTLKLNASYAFSKATRLRFDYIYDVRKMDDYTWQNWVYSDGTRVNVKPSQVTQIVGVSVIQSF